MNNLHYYYSPEEIISLLDADKICIPDNARTNQERGGWGTGVGYGDVGAISAKRYHYLNHSMGHHILNKETRDLLECLNLLARLRSQRVAPGYYLEECCIRVIWYDAASEKQVLGHHLDACAVTIPMFDSLSEKPGCPFLGYMGQEMGFGKAKKHGFSVSTKPRLYIVGFSQLSMDLEMPDGRRYGDVLTDFMNKQDKNNGRKY
jgi:hypothetical protein